MAEQVQHAGTRVDSLIHEYATITRLQLLSSILRLQSSARFAMLVHSLDLKVARVDAQRTVFAFTPISAPYKATVFPLLQRAELDAPATAIAARLRAAGLSTKIDTTSASSLCCLGKLLQRYYS